MIKTLNKLGGKKNFLNLTKGFQEKCTGNITLNCEKLNAFSLRSGTRQLHPLKSLPFNIVLASVIRQEKQIKSIWIGKKMIMYVENQMKSRKNLLDIISDQQVCKDTNECM